MSKEFLIDAIDCFISGDWGANSYSIDTPIKVNCIRGADINNINSNDVVSIPTRYISERSLSNKILSVGDIVVEKSGGSPTQSTGRVAYISESVITSSDAVCSNFCTAFRVKDKWDSKYIYYYLRYIYDLGIFFNFEGKTSGIKNLDLEMAYKSIPIKYIPKEKQQKIVKVLALLDKKIELNNKIISELEQMAKELYDYWFVQFDFPDANGKPYRSSGGKMVYNPTLKREIPEGWDSCYLSDIANIIMGQSPEGHTYNNDGNGMVFYQGSTDFGRIFPSVRQYTTNPTRFAQSGDILMSVRAPVGAINFANEHCCIGRGLAALNSKNGSISYLYHILYYLKVVFDRRNSDGTTFGSITKEDLFSLSIVSPHKNVIKSFEYKVGASLKQQHRCARENIELAELRDWLLPMLMNGQVTVHAETKEETKKETPRINLSQQRNQRFELWLSNQGAAARGEINKATLREIFDAMDEDDK